MSLPFLDGLSNYISNALHGISISLDMLFYPIKIFLETVILLTFIILFFYTQYKLCQLYINLTKKLYKLSKNIIEKYNIRI